MPGLRPFARELYRRDPLLAVVGWSHIVALVAVVAIAPFDDRLILGINPWVKPSKFLISIGIYLWTVAWFMPYLRAPGWMTPPHQHWCLGNDAPRVGMYRSPVGPGRAVPLQ